MLLESTGTRTSLTFRNHEGKLIVGMYYTPEFDSAHSTAVVIPVNSVKYRVGSFRYHYILANLLAKHGYPVFCFDPSNVGDSEGAFDHERIETTLIEIEKGAHVDESIQAMDVLQERFGIRRFLLFGLCGGAITSAMAAANDERVVGAVLLGIPILHGHDPDKKNQVDHNKEKGGVSSDRKAKNILRRKAVALLDVEAWKKLLRGGYNDGTELREVYHSVLRLAAKGLEWKTKTTRVGSLVRLCAEPLSNHDQYNLKLQESLMKIWDRETKLLFVFGSLDPVTGMFEDEFLQPANKKAPMIKNLYEYFVIENGNHIFSATDSQEQLTDIVVNWIKRY